MNGREKGEREQDGKRWVGRGGKRESVGHKLSEETETKIRNRKKEIKGEEERKEDKKKVRRRRERRNRGGKRGSKEGGQRKDEERKVSEMPKNGKRSIIKQG